MTVSTSTSTANYTANGSTTTFAYPFKIFADSDLVVILRNTATGVETVQVLNSAYTVTGAGNVAGGNVVFGTAPASGNTVFIRRELPLTQETDFVPNDPFPAEAHENALDKLTMLVQQTSVDADRAIVFPASDSGLGLNNVLPSVTERRAKLIQFTNDGSVDVISPADLGTAIIGANYVVDTFTGSGGTTIYALSAAPGSTSNTAVYIDGVYQSKSNYSVSGSTLTFSTAPPLNSAIEIVVGDAIPAGAATTAAGVSYTQGGTGSVSRTVQSRLRDFVSVKDFGAVGDGVTDDTAAIQAAIVAIRTNPTSILDTIGGSTITAYSSGVVELPKGVFKISADTLLIYQDLGLTLRGQGSRRTNNSVKAPTTILVSGASSGYGIKAYRSGARGLTIEDLDICYETSAFTGSVLDIIDCPGVTLNRVFIGTYGTTSGTRLQTAAACVRLTYDEFFVANSCVFDGAVDGIWFDDARTELGNTFGGSITAFNECLWYDFTGDMIRHDGLRTREGLRIIGCAFNPISVDPVRCVDLNNVDGLTMATNAFQGSVANKPTTEWLRLVNCTGSSVLDSIFGDFAKAGTLSGMINISGNRVFCTDGFTITGGVVRGGNNEISQGTSGFTFAPTIDLSFDVGPDQFKSSVTYSYDTPADSAFLAGRISYDATADASTSKFRNTSGRVQIGAVDGKQIGVSGSTYTLLSTDTGRTILATGTGAQTFTLPTPVSGTKLTISKISNQDLTVNCAGGTNFYGAGSAYYTSAALTGTAMGGLELEAYATIGWVVKAEVGTWSYS